LDPILTFPEGFHSDKPQLHKRIDQDHGLDKALDNRLISDAAVAIENQTPVELNYEITNRNRTVGTMLGSVVSKRYQDIGLPEDTIKITFVGSAGQSFGAFLPKGITLNLFGDANDYVGKGLSGGKIIIRVPQEVKFVPKDNIIAGNVILYGATGGYAFISGQVGERFGVRNSGAVAVVEGVGDHCCEYMTGGKVVVLGSTGRNFGAGMSGGMAFVYDPSNDFVSRLNMEMVSLENLDEDDVEFLYGIIGEHSRLTDSEVAAKILVSFDSELYHFKKVMPKDYRRVLDVTVEAIERGQNVDEAIMASAHG
jgi:glutamate synthase domain-containing protein 3